MKGIWLYYWDEGNYVNGYMIGFKTQEEAKAHAEEHHKGDYEDSWIEFLPYGELLDIYTGD